MQGLRVLATTLLTSPVLISPALAWDHVDPILIEKSTSLDEFHVTYEVSAKLKADAANVYSLVGTKYGHLLVPPAYNLGSPFGVNIGGINSAIFEYFPKARYDSWLTVGTGLDKHPDVLAAVGMGDAFKNWDANTGIDVTDGGLFWLDPSSSTATVKNGPVLIAQLTVKKSLVADIKMGLVGKTINGNVWRDNDVEWNIHGPPPAVIPGVLEVPSPDQAKYRTFVLNVTLSQKMNSSTVYAALGTKDSPLILPPVVRQSSWISVGMAKSDIDNNLASMNSTLENEDDIECDDLAKQLSSWDLKSGINSSVCGLFWKEANASKTQRQYDGNVVMVGQLTVLKNFYGIAKMAMVGLKRDSTHGHVSNCMR